MKKITTLLFILLSVSFYGQWIEQVSGVTVGLNDVYCISQDVVVVVGDAGTILKTTDGGTSWLPRNSGTTSGLLKVQFANPNVGYVQTNSGTLLKTIDGGESWLPLSVAGVLINAFSCVNENVFYTATSTGLLKKTIDGGVSFVNVDQPVSHLILNIQFVSEQVGYGLTDNILYKTIDGGITWSVIATGEIGTFFFADENTGYFSQQWTGVSKTIDGGLHFSSTGYSGGQTQDLFSLNENVLWEINAVFNLCGCPPSYCISKKDFTEPVDNQEIKYCIGDPYNLELYAIHFANETTGYTVGHWSGPAGPWAPTGTKGIIYKNSTGLNVDLGVNQVVRKDAVKIYPNPASDQIKISFDETPSIG